MPRERPILFSGAMVRAILEGRKTQTRRVVTSPRKSYASEHLITVAGGVPRIPFYDASTNPVTHDWMVIKCPYGQPVDRLWVRETWREYDGRNAFHYAADGTILSKQRDPEVRALFAQRAPLPATKYKWRPSIFMPRSASRITLEITGVRVERLMQITPEDCVAEGIDVPLDYSGSNPDQLERLCCKYRSLWDSINAKRATWLSNPWVWVIEFKHV